MTAKELKPFIGQIVYLMPISNSIRRGTPVKEQVLEDVLVKVNRTKAYTEHHTFHIDGDLDVNNYGYKVFTSKQKVAEYFFRQEAIRVIKAAYPHDWGNVETYLLARIQKELGND